MYPLLCLKNSILNGLNIYFNEYFSDVARNYCKKPFPSDGGDIDT